jgi:hypothetical protein
LEIKMPSGGHRPNAGRPKGEEPEIGSDPRREIKSEIKTVCLTGETPLGVDAAPHGERRGNLETSK